MYRLQFSQLSFTICVVGVLAGSVLLIHRPPAQAQLNNGRVDVLIGFGKREVLASALWCERMAVRSSTVSVLFQQLPPVFRNNSFSD